MPDIISSLILGLTPSKGKSVPMEYPQKTISISKVVICHSGLAGIFLCFQKDSRRALLAGMTTVRFYSSHPPPVSCNAGQFVCAPKK